jgi:hypothetical protein
MPHKAIKSEEKFSQIDILDNPIELFFFKEIIGIHLNSK